jgi:hypothetical protein
MIRIIGRTQLTTAPPSNNPRIISLFRPGGKNCASGVKALRLRPI